MHSLDAPKKTHREVKKPKISIAALADYMVASELARRTIVRDAKFRSTSRVVQHQRARTALMRHFCEPACDVDWLREHALHLRQMLADDDFDRSVLDNNADYVERFAAVRDLLSLPPCTIEAAPKMDDFDANGVRVGLQFGFSTWRVTKTNKIRVGGGTFRYAKGKPLPAEVGLWQSAFMFGYLGVTTDQVDKTPEEKLCLTIDAQSGNAIPAPSDSTKRFKNMLAACASIAERWPKVEPPNGATY